MMSGVRRVKAEWLAMDQAAFFSVRPLGNATIGIKELSGNTPGAASGLNFPAMTSLKAISQSEICPVWFPQSFDQSWAEILFWLINCSGQVHSGPKVSRFLPRKNLLRARQPLQIFTREAELNGAA